MTERIITDSNGRKHITTEPLLHPPQRTWVSLTDEEVITLEQKHMRHEDLSQAIEAKLKEKNNG